MDRFLVFLFSITLHLATLPPKVANNACDFSGGICVRKEVLVDGHSAKPTGPQEEHSGCGKNRDCPLPVCCICGPCCCVCLVPECPVLHISPALPGEEHLKPSGFQDFFPQEVCRAIWKPPAHSA